MPDERGRLSADELRAALAHLGMSQSEFARLLVAMGDSAGDKERTVQRWATGQQDVPGPIAAVLTLLAVVHQAGALQDLRLMAATFTLPTPWSDDPPAGGEAVIVEDRRRR